MFFAAVLGAAGAALAFAAARGLRAAGRAADQGLPWESHRGLVLLLVVLVAVTAAAAILAWGVLLQDLVPQWADVRCIVGVLRVGTGSGGAQGRLPALADATNVLLPLLLVGAGAAAAGHLAGRDRPEGPPARAHLVLLLAVGVLALSAASSMTAWVAIPKAEKHLSSGCCTPEGALVAMDYPELESLSRPGMLLARFATWAVLTAVSWMTSRPAGARYGGGMLRLIGSWLVLKDGSRIVSGLVAPAALGLPHHDCAWCLAGEAPEALWGMALLAAPLLASAWSLAAHLLGPGAGPATDRIDWTLRIAALFGLLGAPLLFAAMLLAS